ncbi:MAG: sialidase family protein [Planctomycetota bacterium]
MNLAMNQVVWTCVLVGLLAVAAPAWAVNFGADVNVDPGQFTIQNEVSMAVVPGGAPGVPALLLAAYNDNPGGTGIGVSHSVDGGATWNASQLAFPISSISGGTLTNVFDPTATADALGNVYVGFVANDGAGGGVNGLYVTHGALQFDGTILWSTPAEVEADPASATGGWPPANPAYRFNDRDQITYDASANRVHIVWIKDRGLYDQSDPGNPPGFAPPSDIFYSSSSAAGPLSFPATPTQINDVGQNLGNMPVTRVASNGTVYATWLDYDVWTGGQGTIWLDKSTDGGTTWGADINVTPVPLELPPLNVKTAVGAPDALAKGAPVLAVSPSNPNELYIVYAADPDRTVAGDGPDDADIFLIKSTDGGGSWSAPLRINNDATVTDQILPWIDVKPDGTIDIAWYDRRNDPIGDQYWDVFIARSTNGGASFVGNVQVNDTSFLTPLGGAWMGEYLGLVTDSTHAYLTWTSSISDGNGDVYFDKVPNAQIPEPATMSLLALGGLAILKRRR